MNWRTQGAKRSVWLADDDELFCQVIETLLSDNYDFKYFTSIQCLTRALAESCPDALLLDIIFNRDKTAGLEFLQGLREDHPVLPVIIISGTKDTEVAAEIGALRIWSFIPKADRAGRFTRRVIEDLSQMLDQQALNIAISDILERDDLFRLITGRSLSECSHMVRRSFRVFVRDLDKIGPTAKGLALRVGTSVGTLNRHYRKATSQSVGDFLRYASVFLARELMRRGCRVGDAAAMVGMSPERMRQRFWAEFGCSPRMCLEPVGSEKAQDVGRTEDKQRESRAH